MTWSRQEPIFPWHPKVLGLSDVAFRLCVTARDYATLMQTDGFIARRLVPRLYGATRMTKKLEAAIGELTAVPAGEAHPLWEVDEAAGGYRIHDYRDYVAAAGAPEDEQTEARAAARTAAKVAGGRARAAGAARVGGRFVKAAEPAVSPCQRQGDTGAAGAAAGDPAGAAGDQQPPAATSIAFLSPSAGTSRTTSKSERNARAAGAAGASDDVLLVGAPAWFAELLTRARAQRTGVDAWLAVLSTVWEDVKGGELSPIGRFVPLLRQRQRGEPLWRVAGALRAYLRDPQMTLPSPRDFLSRYNVYAVTVRRGPMPVVVDERSPPSADEIARGLDELRNYRRHGGVG